MQNKHILHEGPINSIKKMFNSPEKIGRFLNYTAAGGLVGASTGGFVGFLYGVKVYETRDKTLKSIENKILDPETSDFKRRELIDMKNMILSMSDEEYRNFVIKKYYGKGSAIGSTIGSVAGSFLSRGK